jgi:threonylcarbamoyladenosine tRNA methylthiotransferase MtaB
MPSYRIVTLGCKLNQADSLALESRLARLGMTRADDAADLVVLNTCTVTGAADREARQIARRLRRAHPRARLLVTGCYAERDGAALASIAGVDQVVGMRDQAARVAAFAADAFAIDPAPPAAAAVGDDRHELGPFGATTACDPAGGDRTRAFLKIQDGCDLRCTYCIIPSVRGGARSLPADDVLRRLRDLTASGYREVVFTGVNTGDWGRDLAPRIALHDLLRRALALESPGRVRLNSLEPRTVTPEVIGLMADSGGRLAPHLQIPLQSGSDAVLARMRRNYRTADYARVLGALRRSNPDAGLGADVIVGFPGETDAEFARTCRFIEGSELNYLHVFPYSQRPGTPAAAQPDQVTPAAIKERGVRLRAIGHDLARRFRRRFVGRDLEALVLRETRADGRLRALTGNFIDLWLDPQRRDPGSLVNRLVAARVTDAGDETLAALSS